MRPLSDSSLASNKNAATNGQQANDVAALSQGAQLYKQRSIRATLAPSGAPVAANATVPLADQKTDSAPSSVNQITSSSSSGSSATTTTTEPLQQISHNGKSASVQQSVERVWPSEETQPRAADQLCRGNEEQRSHTKEKHQANRQQAASSKTSKSSRMAAASARNNSPPSIQQPHFEQQQQELADQVSHTSFVGQNSERASLLATGRLSCKSTPSAG